MFIFALYQFKLGRDDSWLSILLAAFCFAWTVIGLTVVLVLAVLRQRRDSHTFASTSPLYSRYGWYNSAGMIYRQFRPKYHFWWFAPLALASFVRACFIAFGQGNPWAQVIGLVVVEFLVLVTCIGFRPHKDKKGDWLGAFLAFARMCSFGLLIAFIPSMDVDPITRTIVGFAVIVTFGLPVVLLFFGLLFNLGEWLCHRLVCHRRYTDPLYSLWLCLPTEQAENRGRDRGRCYRKTPVRHQLDDAGNGPGRSIRDSPKRNPRCLWIGCRKRSALPGATAINAPVD